MRNVPLDPSVCYRAPTAASFQVERPPPAQKATTKEQPEDSGPLTTPSFIENIMQTISCGAGCGICGIGGKPKERAPLK